MPIGIYIREQRAGGGDVTKTKQKIEADLQLAPITIAKSGNNSHHYRADNLATAVDAADHVRVDGINRNLEWWQPSTPKGKPIRKRFKAARH